MKCEIDHKFKCSSYSDEDNSSFLVFQSHHLKCYYKFYFHCIFIIYLILFYVIDSVGLTKKTLFLNDFYDMRPLFWLSTIVQESQQSVSRGCVLAFYRIAPCLNFTRNFLENALRDFFKILPSLRHLCQVRDPNVVFRKIALVACYSVLYIMPITCFITTWNQALLRGWSRHECRQAYRRYPFLMSSQSRFTLWPVRAKNPAGYPYRTEAKWRRPLNLF